MTARYHTKSAQIEHCTAGHKDSQRRAAVRPAATHPLTVAADSVASDGVAVVTGAASRAREVLTDLLAAAVA